MNLQNTKRIRMIVCRKSIGGGNIVDLLNFVNFIFVWVNYNKFRNMV